MPLKISKGNMYNWVTHTHSHLGGECPHKCSYCYVQRNRFGVAPRYKGAVNIIDFELDVKYGKGKTIFIEHMNDMFANGVDPDYIQSILAHCNKYPDNKYVFQTKNPKRAYYFKDHFPQKFMIGTTIESNRIYENITKAPEPIQRYEGMMKFSIRAERLAVGLKQPDFSRRFITIEPILDFDVRILVDWILDIRPSFVNIGADSKGCNLLEPPKEKINELINALQNNGIVIKKKTNLSRILGG